MYQWHTWFVFAIVFLAGAFIASKFPAVNLVGKLVNKAGTVAG